MAWLSDKFVLLVVTIVTVVDCAPKGYDYSKPAVVFEIPNRQNVIPETLTGSRLDQVYRNTISYSTPNKNTSQYQSNVPFESHLNNPSSNILSQFGAQENFVTNNQALLNIQNSAPLLNLHNEPKTSSGNLLDNTYSTLQSNNYFQNTDIETVQNGGFSVQNKPNYTPSAGVNNYQTLLDKSLGQQRRITSNQSKILPVVTKHIYFHVPPPDTEERLQPVLSQPKKTYRILFIKLPAQETKSNAILQSNYNPIGTDEKTLIYVLVKRPEENQALVPTSPKLSEHEVLFVKYSGNPSLSTEPVEKVVEIPRRNLNSSPQVNSLSVPSIW